MNAVIFDMDGVLIDSEPLWREAFRRVILDQFQFPVSNEQLIPLQGKRVPDTLRELWKIIGTEEPEPEEQDELAKMVIEVASSLHDKEDRPIVESVAIVPALHSEGVLLAVASSSELRFIERVLDKLNLRQYFAVVESAYGLERGKPYPDIFQRTADQLGVKPPDCVVIEDSKVGVNAAIAAGMRCIGLWRSPEEPPVEFRQCARVLQKLTVEEVLAVLRIGA